MFSGNSKFASDIRNIIETVSKQTSSILLYGEYGTGKKLFAQNVHCRRCGSFKTFFDINCRTMDSEIIKNVFSNINKCESGSKITIFLNYTNLLSLEEQKLLQMLLSSVRIDLSVQIISSSIENLEILKERNEFRSDLLHKLNSLVLQFLPLRQRKEDILPIATFYCDKFKKESGNCFIGFSESSVSILENNFWNGNCDELINAIQRAFIVNQKPGEKLIIPSDLGLGNPYDDLEDKSLKNALDTFKRDFLIKVLNENGWNQTKVSKILGIQRTYVIRLMNELHIRR